MLVRYISCFVFVLFFVACGDDDGARDASTDVSPPSDARDGGADTGDSGLDALFDADANAQCPSELELARRFDETFRQPARLALGHLDTLFEPADNSIAAMVGQGLGVDVVDTSGAPTRRVFAAFSEHDDVANAVQYKGVLRSEDAGQSFGAYTSGIATPPGFAAKLRDGRILSLDFVPHARVEDGDDTVLTLGADVSRDDGLSWTESEVTLRFPRLVGGYGRPSGHLRELADGSILLPYYMRTVGAPGGEALLLVSQDGGVTFEMRSKIATPGDNIDFSEPDVVQLPDGSLYAVFRQHVRSGNRSSLSHLLEARSRDGGLTWSEAQPISVAFGDARGPRVGINPQLQLLPNGVLVLSSGRPDNFVAMATEPSFEGVAWEQGAVTYQNYPRASTRFGPEVQRVHGSSGNTALIEVSSNRLIQVGDNCAAGWGCPSSDSEFDVDNRYRVWRRFIDVVSENVGKLNLGALVEAGRVEVGGNMTWTSETRPRTNAQGAFDGSVEPWSSAIRGGGDGEFLLTFDSPIEITRIGLALDEGVAVAARIDVSLDGRCFLPLVSEGTSTDYALRYTDFEAPVRARVLRVQVGANACPAEVGGTCAILRELEVYTTVNSFENDAINVPPRGYEVTRGVWVTGSHPGVSGRALRIVDNSSDAISQAVWRGTSSSQKRLSFSLLRVDGSTAFLFGVHGTDSAGDDVRAYHLGVFSDGSIRSYNGAWEAVSAAGLVSAEQAHSIQVDATTDGAVIYVDGRRVGEVTSSAELAALDRHAFSSSGTVPVGDHVVIDNVYFH